MIIYLTERRTERRPIEKSARNPFGLDHRNPENERNDVQYVYCASIFTMILDRLRMGTHAFLTPIERKMADIMICRALDAQTTDPHLYVDVDASTPIFSPAPPDRRG